MLEYETNQTVTIRQTIFSVPINQIIIIGLSCHNVQTVISSRQSELYPLIKLWDGDLHTINRFLAFHFDKRKNANRILACERLSVIVATGDNVESAISVGDSDVNPLQKKIKNKCAHKVAKQQTTERLFFFKNCLCKQQRSSAVLDSQQPHDLQQWPPAVSF